MRKTISTTYQGMVAICGMCVALLALDPAAVRADCPKFNGPGGGEVTIEDAEICLVDGPGNWIIWGVGQDVVIKEKKDGKGNLTLHGFGKITIKLKNGEGQLIVEDDNKSVILEKVDGPGDVYLRNKGYRKILDKNGPGNVYFRGKPPIVKKWDGTGKLIRE